MVVHGPETTVDRDVSDETEGSETEPHAITHQSFNQTSTPQASPKDTEKSFSIMCVQCSATISSRDQSCPWCGAIVMASGTDEVVQTLQNACPICQQADQIQKLSSIVSASTHDTRGSSHSVGTTDIHLHGEIYNRKNRYIGSEEQKGHAVFSGMTMLNAREQSVLANMLSPLEPPEKPELATIGFGDWYEDNVGC